MNEEEINQLRKQVHEKDVMEKGLMIKIEKYIEEIDNYKKYIK